MVQAVRRPHFKLAAGEGEETDFEGAFSNLVHGYLRERAPSLLDYEVGFQVVDRNDEGDKAVGVTAFKVGSAWLMVPAFFVKGSVKGTDMLFLKNQDTFVPLRENWLNYIINRKPNILGEGVDRNSQSLGMRSPNLNIFRQSPGKYSAHVPRAEFLENIKIAADAVKRVLATKPSEILKAGTANLNLIDFLKAARVENLECLLKACREWPELAEIIDNFHGLETLKTAMAPACANSAKPRPKKQIIRGSVLPTKVAASKLQIFTAIDHNTPVPICLSESEREHLLRERVLIKDARDDNEVSIAYKVQKPQSLTNPTETGLYEVLTKPGDFERCLVLVHPYGPERRYRFVTVIRTGDNANWMHTTSDKVWISEQIYGDEYQKWYDGLSEAKDLGTGDGLHVLLGPSGASTLPFRVEKSLSSHEGTESYEVDFETYGPEPSSRNQPTMDWEDYSKYSDGQRLHIGGHAGSKLRCNAGDLYVPAGFKKVRAKAVKTDDEGCCDMGSSVPPIQPGSLMDAETWMRQKTSALTVYHDGTDVEINQRRMSPLTALASLVRDYGLREKAARDLLKIARTKRKLACRLKVADSYLTSQQPTMPQFDPQTQSDNFLGTELPIQQGQESQQVPLANGGAQTDPNVYNPNPQLDSNEISRLYEAAQTGQKEIFDTSAISSLLKATRDESMVTRYLGDLTKAIDSLARIRMHMYWSGDEFAEQYGKSDMPEIEDALQNSFEDLGDVVLKLKLKSVDAYPEENYYGADIGAAARD